MLIHFDWLCSVSTTEHLLPMVWGRCLWVGFMDWTWLDMHCVRLHATFDQGRSISILVFCPVAESNQARDVHDRDQLVEVLEQSEQKIAIRNTWMLQFVSIRVSLLNLVAPLNLKLQQATEMLRRKMSAFQCSNVSEHWKRMLHWPRACAWLALHTLALQRIAAAKFYPA